MMKKKRQLLYSLTKKDFRIQYFRGSGAGGQHRNKTDTACRITHIASGSVGECQEHKSQSQNRKTAYKRLHTTNKFKIWHTKKCNEILSGETIEERVEKSLKQSNIKVEVKENNKWVLKE